MTRPIDNLQPKQSAAIPQGRCRYCDRPSDANPCKECNMSGTAASLAGWEPQTKDRLTADDPPGWYECRYATGDEREGLVSLWDGSRLFRSTSRYQTPDDMSDFTNFRGPLVHAPELQQKLGEAEQEIDRLGEVIESRHASHRALTLSLEQQLSEAQATIARLKEQAAASNTSWAALFGLWLDSGDKASQLQAELERLKQERDAALKQLSEMATKCGQAEGKLLASEQAGLLEEWQQRAEAAEARVKELELDRATDGKHREEELAAIRTAIGNPNATVPQICEAIATLRNWNERDNKSWRELFEKMQAVRAELAGEPHPHAASHNLMQEKLERSEARVQELQQEVKLLEDTYGGDAAALFRASLDRVKELEAENSKLRDERDKYYQATETWDREWRKDISERNRYEHYLKVIEETLKPWVDSQTGESPEMLAIEAAKEIQGLRRQLNAEREARKEDLAVIERHSKALRQLDRMIADAIGCCKKHNHCGGIRRRMFT